MQHQQTFDDVRAVTAVSVLNRTQQKVLKLLAHQMTQSQIANRLKITRQYVNQIVSRLSRLGILKKSQQTPGRYNIIYDVPDHLKRQVEQAAPEVHISACRVHNIRLKYTYDIDGPGTVHTGRKTGFIKSWRMRGGDRHKFQVKGRPGFPDITIDVHPGTLIAYPDGGQTMAAETVEEVETVIKAAIHEAAMAFEGMQIRHGVRMTVHRPNNTGKQITETHYAFPFPDAAAYATGQTRLPGFTIDGSPKDHGMPGYSEIETQNAGAAYALDAGIHKIFNLDSILARAIPSAMSDFMERTLLPKLDAIKALQQGGITQQQQINNLTQVVAAIMLQNERLMAQNAELKGGM